MLKEMSLDISKEAPMAMQMVRLMVMSLAQLTEHTTELQLEIPMEMYLVCSKDG